MNKYKIIETDDGTSSIYSEEFSQAMHSTSGAWEESLLKHIYPSEILKTTKNTINILDVGFGLGYNSLALIYEVSRLKLNVKINIISFEFDRSFEDLLLTIFFNDDRDIVFKKLLKAFQNGFYEEKSFSIKIIFGDARNNLSILEDNYFDLIFQDPFSPGKNPELWSLDYFKKIYKVLADDGVITTYSSALHVRKAMIESGFSLAKGPSVGKKREGTLATKNNILQTKLENNEIEEITKNIKATPYRDCNLNLERETILKNRIEEMATLRQARKLH